MKYKKYGDAPTVAEVIEELRKMPQEAKCYVRTKYHGNSNWAEDIPLNHGSIGEMHPEGAPTNVTFLV
jgi:hypothetical protein